MSNGKSILLSDRVLTVEKDLIGIREDVSRLDHSTHSGFEELKKLFATRTEDQTSAKRFTITIFASLAGVLVVLIPSTFIAFWFVITLQINAVASTAARDVSQDMTLVKVQNSGLIQDRVQIHTELEALQKQFFDAQAAAAAFRSAMAQQLIEHETQFDVQNQLLNTQLSQQQRTNAMMWNHIGGLGTYPTAPYYFPNVSQHNRPVAGQ